MTRPRVLVVEDRPSVLKLMTTILEPSCDVTTAATGGEALTHVATASFEVVLTDVRMPGASGFDVLRAVRDRAPQTRVVMITAYANVADAVAAMRLGAYDYVAKPLDASDIALVVARAIASARGEDEPGGAATANALRESISLFDESENVALGFHRAVEEARRKASHDYLVRLMRLHRGNVTQAAKQAGITRESLHRVLRQYDVRAERPALERPVVRRG